MPNLSITLKALGRRAPLSDWTITRPPEWTGGEPLTLRALIERVVRTEVEAFNQRQRKGVFLRALTEKQIENASESGKIDSGGKETVQHADADDAVGVALQGFEDGLYLVLIDDTEQKTLDAQVYLKPDTRLTFIRLTMLAGG